MNQHKTFIITGKTLILLLVVLLFSSQLSIAQKPEVEIERFVKDFTKAYENITKSRDVETVLKYVSKDLNSAILKSSVMDNFGLIQSDFSDFQYHLRQLVETDGMSITYKIKNIYRSQVRGGTGVVVCELNVEVVSRGEIWSKGSEMTTFVLKKHQGEWKIMQFFVVGLEEEQLKGICMIEFFESSLGDYVIKTIVPQGESYDIKLNTLEFSNGDKQIYIKANNEITYTWDGEGMVNRLNDEDSSIKGIGKAEDAKNAAMVIITKDLYAENCTEFKMKH